MLIIGQIIDVILTLFLVVLLVRMLLSFVPLFAPTWEPKGIVLVLAEVVYTITDPPVRFFQRLLPQARLGNVTLDLGFIVVWFLVLILLQINAAIF